MLQGMELFMWQAEATEEEWDTWATDHSRNNGKVRFVVLRENQTVIFPPGTIHSVARLNKEKTFCATGHFLQWSDLETWLKVLKKQLEDSETVNEDVGDDSILSLLENAKALIEGRIDSERLEIVGGLERANNLVDQIKEIIDALSESQKPAKRKKA
ncbi:lysine-specific demethylase 2B [Fusarium globosum]|uniref:Lysine-specific demethylase 2B n=1 Tax=Fusarium globosum TaxID=78864 RepID=A0A8H5Y5J5_9HYPO|nr:lysine-specific demethylase 2B [Fusarium globosum]